MSKLRGVPDDITAIIVRVSGPPAAAEDVALPTCPNKTLLARAWRILALVCRYLLSVGPTDRPPAKAYRSRICSIERSLLDKVNSALRSLRERDQANDLDLDWGLCDEHRGLADSLVAINGLPGAFREYCRALLALMPLLPPPE